MAESTIINYRTKNIICNSRGLIKFNWEIALIDNDIRYLEVMKSVTTDHNLKITAFKSLLDFSNTVDNKNYNAILLDYFLGSLHGLNSARYLQRLLPNIPVVLLSDGLINEKAEQWPRTLKAFIPKHIGASAVVDRTIHMLQQISLEQD